MTRLRDLVEFAVERREPLDTKRFHELARTASDEDLAHWREQVELDRAIARWRDGVRQSRSRTTISCRIGTGLASATAAAAIAWLALAHGTVQPASQESLPAHAESVAVLSLPTGKSVEAEPTEPVVAPRAMQGDRFARASVTAERLAYAFEPVGEQVGTVMRFLVDAVPGTDVFSM